MAKHRNIRTYVFKAAWRSTAKWIKIRAKDEDEAIVKALRSKDIKGCPGCLNLDLIEVRKI